MQRSYRIRATTTAGEALWDSGVVESDACFDIRYGGQTLESMQRVCWGVEIVDSDGWQARSEPTWFETGLLDAADILPAAKDNLLGVWLNGAPATLPDMVYWGSLLPVQGQVKPGRNSLCVLASANTHGFFPVDRRSPVVTSDIYGGETRLEQPGWDGPGFDDSGWPTVRIGETPQTQLIAQTAPPLRPTRTLRAVSVTEPVPGRFVFDFGQNMPGWVKLRATGPAGSCITLRFAELLNADGTADQSNLRRAECTDRCILRGEVGGDAVGESFAPRFTYHGFRYVEVEGYPGTPTADDIEAVIVHSDCRETRDMTFASPLLQRIWTNAL